MGGLWNRRARRAAREKRLQRLCGHLWHRYRALTAERRGLLRERGELLARAEKAEQQVRVLSAQVAAHARHRFGQRTERRPEAGQQRGTGGDGSGGAGEPPKKGQKPGSKGHGRRRGRHSGLPVEVVVHGVAEEDKRCENCGRERRALPAETSEELDVVFLARLLSHQRECYISTCDCWKHGLGRKFVRAAAPQKLIPRCGCSTGTIAFVVVSRYLWGLPLHRITTILGQLGADVPDGTMVGIFAALEPLLEPLYRAIRARNRQSKYLHADETTWRRLWARRGKRGWIWCFVGTDTVVYLFDEGRGHKVVLDYLGLTASEWGETVIDLMCDFMAAYDKAMRLANANQKRLELTRCWSHYRRLFLEVCAKRPGDREVAAQVEQWLTMIADLFVLHRERDHASDSSPEQAEAQSAFQGCLNEMEDLRALHLGQQQLAPELRHVLSFGQEHWEELTRCAADPHHPMNNNVSERHARLPVIIRKNAYGSGSATQAKIAAQVWTIGKTAEMNNRNPFDLMLAYLEACAAAGGSVPENWMDFLPCPPPSPPSGGPGEPVVAGHDDAASSARDGAEPPAAQAGGTSDVRQPQAPASPAAVQAAEPTSGADPVGDPMAAAPEATAHEGAAARRPTAAPLHASPPGAGTAAPPARSPGGRTARPPAGHRRPRPALAGATARPP